MRQEIKLWYARNFKILTTEQAKSLGLTWYANVHGSSINFLNCRSLWKDYRGRQYRISELHQIS